MADGKTLEAIIANRYEVMASYAAELQARGAAPSSSALKAQGAQNSARWRDLRAGQGAGCTATTTRSRRA
ncbi:MAG: hypothetical protein MZW92_23920 [Comamonadaceae bacterium]|nr:hypothetical protein [Comamonadaceae bacterium]